MASVRETRHGTYEVLYRDPAGRQRSRSFRRRADAALYAKTVDTDKARGDWADPRLARATFGQYSELWWAAAQLRPRTAELYASLLRNWVLPRFNDVPVAQIDAPTLRAWAKGITDSGRSASHRAGCINIVRLVLGTAVEAGAIKANPALRLKLPTPAPKAEMRFLTPAQVETLAQAMKYPQGALVVRLAAYTGLRAGEIYALRVRSIQGQRLTVTDSLTELHGPGREQVFLGSTKTYRNRVVSMPGPLASAVEDHVRDRKPDDLVFAYSDGSPIQHTAFYRDEFKPAVRQAGLDPKLRFHDLRHTCAAMMISLGAHPKAIMERLGHSTITVTL
ncbi:MAG: tyrosine-type recombinase/integrase, partial [Acidimicrobiales bacterium]